MCTISVIKQPHVHENISFNFLKCSIFFAVNALLFYGREEALSAGIIVLTARSAHVATDTVLLQHIPIVEWFVKNGIKVWSVNEGEQRFESHTDRLTNYIRFWQADGESQKTSIRTKTALGQMVQEGRFRGGSAPYGYRLEKSGVYNKRKHEVNKLVIDEEEADVARMMFNLCVASGFGRWRLAMFLNDKGIKN